MTQAEEPQATPYRPTISNPAQLPVPGYLEMELGWQSLRKKEAEEHRHSVPYLFKFAFTDRIGVLVGTEVVVINAPEGQSSSAGFGDLTPLLKLRFPLGFKAAGAFGIEAGVKIPTAPSTVGSQQTDYLFNGIYSVNVGIVSVDLNLGYTRLGGTPEGTGKDLVSWAASGSVTLMEGLSVAGEFAGSSRKTVKPFTQFLASTSYFLSPGIVADAGMAFGLNGASQEWTAFAGLTFITARLF